MSGGLGRKRLAVELLQDLQQARIDYLLEAGEFR